MKMLIVAPGPRGRWETVPFLDALAAEFGADRVPWHEGSWPVRIDVDVVFSFVKFDHLLRAPKLDWQGFTGLRVHYDWDALQDGYWWGSPYAGAWGPTMVRQHFDLLITTGLQSRNLLREKGLVVETVHKGCDHAIIDLKQKRSKVFCTFGYDYPARVLAKSALRRAGVNVDDIKTNYADLGPSLNNYVACILCTFEGRIRGGTIGRALHRAMPQRFVEVGRAPEPMIKLFEASAAGCAPIVEWTPDLAALGFEDGKTAVIYKDIEELVDRVLEYRAKPERLREIGRAAAALATRRHTWQHRAREIRVVLERHVHRSSTLT